MPASSRRQKKKSYRSRKSSWSLSGAWNWLTEPLVSRKQSRQKRSVAYCDDPSRHGRKSRYKTAETYSRSKKSKKEKKGKSGTVCVCAMGCQKKHEHGEKCQAAVVCVCGRVGKGKKGSRKSRKMSVAYEGTDKSMVKTGSRLFPKLREGTLRQHGYDHKLPAKERHEALRKAVIKNGPTTVIRKLNVVATLNKNRHPELAKHFKHDAEWVKAEFGTTAHPK